MATKQYVRVNFDEFENRTDFTHNGTVNETLGPFKFNLRRVKKADSDILVIDYKGGFIGNGTVDRIIINYDGENKEVQFQQHNLDVDVSQFGVTYKEIGIFLLGQSEDENKKILEDICRAKILKIRIYYQQKIWPVKESVAEEILNHFREFYDDVYESNEFAMAISAFQEKPKSGCFIATAAMGTEFHPDVLLLRKFRDEWLLHGRFKNAGQLFVKTYYRYSPTIADFISTNKILRAITRWCVVRPLGLIASQLLKQKN